MGSYKHAVRSFEETMSNRSPSFRHRLSSWKGQRTVQSVGSPTNPFRARTLGYKAAKAYVIVRVRVKRGKRSRKKADLGRKPGKNRKFINPGMSLQAIAEGKAVRRHTNLDLVNSYFVGEDGVHKYYEIIMKDTHL